MEERSNLARRLDQDFQAGIVRGRAFEMFVSVLDHDDGAVDHFPNVEFPPHKASKK
jgi:hypothetical protein